MTRNTKIVLGIGAAAAVYFLIIKKATKVIVVKAYDGTSRNLTVENGLSADAQQKITTWFGSGMAQSVNPAVDEQSLEASLKSQGYPTAAASSAALYATLSQGAQIAAGTQNPAAQAPNVLGGSLTPQAAQGFGAGALMGRGAQYGYSPGIDAGAGMNRMHVYGVPHAWHAGMMG